MSDSPISAAARAATPRQGAGRQAGLRWVAISMAAAAAVVALSATAQADRGANREPTGDGARLAMHGGPGGHGGARGPAGPGDWLMGRGLDRMLDTVNASEAQRTQIRQIAAAARADLQAQRAAHEALRDRAMSAFTAPTLDAREVESVRQQMLAQHDATTKRLSQAMFDASQVLTPEQRAQMAAQMKARGESMRRHHEERQRPGAPKQQG